MTVDAQVTLTSTSPTFDPQVLADLRDRLDRTRRPTGPDEDWARGVPGAWLDDLLADWRDFDVPALQERLSRARHLRADIDGRGVHVVIAEGRGPDPLPLLLCNGWPSSFLEYLDALPLLTDPGAHGGDPSDAFTVIAPALPGFGLSDAPPPGGLGQAQVARLWHDLMSVGFGHQRYVAHGSDLGAGIVMQLARAQPDAVAGIHLATPGLPLPPRPWTDAEAAYARAVDSWTAAEGSYAHQHATKPNTAAAALQDSPAGLAAWVAEKVVAWSPQTDTGDTTFPRDVLLATLTLYWATGTIGTSMLPYWNFGHGGRELPDPRQRPAVPTAITNFGGERIPLPPAPRDLAERYVQVSDWHEYDRGGHFPAACEPQLFAETLRAVFRPARGNISSADAPP
ncbi:epoxide hydrolase family protein [Allobranchiibius sp. CTAmp26]|uniref:epoxide hydrolase family protein n=1 Tax=Allobranchiibius sp. CTAmp26 TaxID=2815214 RepID=UPI001AA10F91|nr:epoxide hydrolase family protein [Allobranchiibius sp. CTAmp26]MBO1753940.1 alpha/beta fold hydrolase [Allobranchiibius sp. CTAmp26]